VLSPGFDLRFLSNRDVPLARMDGVAGALSKLTGKSG
jgi:hypothetical protein